MTAKRNDIMTIRVADAYYMLLAAHCQLNYVPITYVSYLKRFLTIQQESYRAVIDQ